MTAMTTLSHEEKVLQAIEVARKREEPKKTPMEIPFFIRKQSKSNDEYLRWVRSYFKSSHPHLVLIGIDKKNAVLIKKK